MAGALIIAAGMAGVIAAASHPGAAVTTWDLVPGLVAAGLGLGAVIAPPADIVLARVPRQDPGAASGMFSTGLQLGNSIGIALIGVIFFGMLGSQSGPAAGAVAPALRSGIVAAGLPAAYTGQIEDKFGTCLHDRLVAADPTVTPAACQLPAGKVLPPAAHRVLAGGRGRGPPGHRGGGGPHPVVPGRRIPAELPAHARPATLEPGAASASKTVQAGKAVPARRD
jgi:hypothetical protein